MRLLARPAIAAIAIAPLVAVLDQVSKAWVLHGSGLSRGNSLDIWGPLRLTLVNNGGVSFGLLQSGGGWGRWGLSVFSLMVIVALAAWVRRAERVSTGVAVGLITGGALGNVIDRVRFGTVVDFIDLQALWFPWIFNVADSAITIGIAGLLLESLLTPQKSGR